MNLPEIADFFEKLWFERRGLVSAIIVSTIASVPFLYGALGLWPTVIATVLVDAAIALIWWWSRIPPKTPSDKIGFLVSISCSDDNESKKLQEDFIRPLRELVPAGKTGMAFHFLEMPQHIAKAVQDVEQAHTLRRRCRAHFMIYGRVRLREINKEDVHVLDLEGAVAHNPVPEHVSGKFALKFSELMPRKVMLAKENDVLSFQFTSEWTDLVARYVIGYASAISGDLDYAESLFQDVKSKLHGKSTSFDIYIKLKERVQLRLSELHKARAYIAYTRWVESKDVKLLLQAESHLAFLDPIHQDEKETLNLKAILAFVLHRNVREAIELIKKVKAPEHSQWHLNMAFLLGYSGNLKNAVRHYRLAENIEITPDTLNQIEAFILWVLNAEPERYQLYYCLGFFNWKVKGDLVSAEKDFTDFLDKVEPQKFQKEVELTRQWINEIRLDAACAARSSAS